MRRIALIVTLAVISLSMFAQTPRPPAAVRERCCTTKIYDATDKLVGDLIRWDDRFPTVPLSAIVRYEIKGGDEVAIVVAPETIRGLQEPGGSVALFTTPDCSGNTMFAMLSWPPLMKRYAMVLSAGPAGTVHFAPTNAWLWVTDALPSRVSPGATVFQAQWGDNGACVPYPPPGYTVTPSPFGGYWMNRVEDLLAKYKRPFYSRQ